MIKHSWWVRVFKTSCACALEKNWYWTMNEWLLMGTFWPMMVALLLLLFRCCWWWWWWWLMDYWWGWMDRWMDGRRGWLTRWAIGWLIAINWVNEWLSSWFCWIFIECGVTIAAGSRSKQINPVHTMQNHRWSLYTKKDHHTYDLSWERACEPGLVNSESLPALPTSDQSGATRLISPRFHVPRMRTSPWQRQSPGGSEANELIRGDNWWRGQCLVRFKKTSPPRFSNFRLVLCVCSEQLSRNGKGSGECVSEGDWREMYGDTVGSKVIGITTGQILSMWVCVSVVPVRGALSHGDNGNCAY